MAVSFLGPAGPSEGLSEVDKNTGEPENTYILRPIFQQRRVADWARRAMWGVGPRGLGA